MSDPKKHHYIPQCYQRRFSTDNVCVKYFDKGRGVVCSEEIGKFCQIENLYYLAHSSNPYYIETEFFSHNIEDKLGRLLIYFDSINGDCDKIDFNVDRKASVAKQIVLQYMRTPQYRDIKYKNESNAYLSQLYTLLEYIGFAIEELRFEGDKAEFHKRRLCDEQEISEIIGNIVDMKWELLYTPQEEFYTSDNPVVIKEKKDMPVTYCDAIKYFNEIYFPLNPNLLLHIMSERTDSRRHIAVRTIDQDEIIEINNIIKNKAPHYILYQNQYK